ncbi:MAG TPA: ABC transporter substrate-binding protein, partial [Clostridia bacterium]|nr:ABC transporter substrate-binding protein [Clostridia bacterium]
MTESTTQNDTKNIKIEEGNMVPKKTSSLAITFVVILSLILAACTPAAPAQKTPLKFTALRILDVLPMYVAQEEGFFEKHGVTVELLPVASPPERDQLVSIGQADGMINEISGTLYFNKDKVQVQIVRFARSATPETHLFSILASKQSGITTVEELKGKSIGISDGTIIAYLTDRMLAEENFGPEDIKTTSIPSLSDRMTLLNSGQLDAAMLPEPLTSLAIQQGAVVVLDDSKYPEYSNSTITFRKDVLDKRPEDVRNFLAAIEDAVNAINANPEKY